MTRNCPRCNVEMKLLNVKDVEIDACPSCAGIWFDQNELDKIIGAEEISPEQVMSTAPNVTKVLDCPQCNIKMKCSTMEDLTFDFCEKCNGTWLDAGELTELGSILKDMPITDGSAPYKVEDDKGDKFLGKIKGIFKKK